jgi:hypothetical protein
MYVPSSLCLTALSSPVACGCLRNRQQVGRQQLPSPAELPLFKLRYAKYLEVGAWGRGVAWRGLTAAARS